MLYEYKCENCKILKEVAKSYKEIDRPEMCECGKQMKRVPSLVNFVAPVWHNTYDYGLGTEVRSETHRKNILKEIKDREGKELIPVGNDRPEDTWESVEKKQEREWDDV